MCIAGRCRSIAGGVCQGHCAFHFLIFLLYSYTPVLLYFLPNEILIHHPDLPSPLYSQMLATLGLPDFPTPVGVIRQIQRPTYESLIHNQGEQAKAKRGTGTWQELLHGNSTWTVE